MNHPYDKALAQLTAETADAADSHAHSTFIGLRMRNGRYVLDEPEVLVVQTPTPKNEHVAMGDKAIPPDMMLGGQRIPIDVQADTLPPRPQLLCFDNPAFVSYAVLQAGEQHRGCQAPLVKGGSQIQPAGANWVGTAGGMMGFEQTDGSVIWGMLTNAHVTGLTAAPGTVMGQPVASNTFAKVLRVFAPVKGQNSQSKLDLALLDCRSASGLTCSPDQVTLGRLGTAWKDAALRMTVAKDGRTTGGTTGICVGIKGTSWIGYGTGDNRRVTDLDIFARPEGGDVSAAGDSGSMILEAGTNHFVSLLFAGGGGQTLGCAARNVMAACAGLLPNIGA